jgi:hypothetical protein
MKITRKGIIGAAGILLITAANSLAIEGLNLSVQCTNVVLSWPSVDGSGDSYVVMRRTDLSSNSTWTVLANYYAAATGTNVTMFIDYGVITNPSCGCGTGGSFAIMAPMMRNSAAVPVALPPLPMAMCADGLGVAVPLLLYPPGYDLSSLNIFDPSSAAWVSGSDYVAGPALPGGATPDVPMPRGGGSGGGGATNVPPETGFYEVVKMGATLYGLTNGMTIADVVDLPVEVAETSGQLTTLTLEDSGVPIASTIHVAPFELPVPIMVLDTTLMSNGVHTISVHAFTTDPADGTEDGSGAIYEDDSPAFTVTVSNEISFPNWMPAFGELGNSMVISAQSAHTNVDWYLDVYDSQYNYIGTMWAVTPDGNIFVVWDLVGPDGTLHTDNTFEFVLSTFSGGSLLASRVVPPSYKVTDPWAGPGDWVVVNQQAWNGVVGSDELDMMTDGFATEAQMLGLTVRPTAPAGSGYRIRFDDTNNAYSDWANFRAALYNPLSRNLFYLGHGSPKGMGYSQRSTNLSILATEIASNLLTIPPGQTNSHKYRFVCIDGCSTAPGTLPESFGIIHKENVNGTNYVDASLRPSAFAGWDDDKYIGLVGSINLSHVYFFQHFQYEWAFHGVKEAFDNAARYGDVVNLSTSHLKVFGYWFLGLNQFNR